MFLEVLSSIAYKNNILGWCINTFNDRVAVWFCIFHFSEHTQDVAFSSHVGPLIAPYHMFLNRFETCDNSYVYAHNPDLM